MLVIMVAGRIRQKVEAVVMILFSQCLELTEHGLDLI